MAALTLNEICRRKRDAEEDSRVSVAFSPRFNAWHVLRGKILIAAYDPDQQAIALGHARRAFEGTDQ